MSKTHYGWSNSYDPYGEDIPDKYACGSTVGYDYSASTIKADISCKKCLKKFDAFVKETNEHLLIQAQQMGEMADFFIEQENKKNSKDE
ncbi:hypothetical protein [Myroides odoratus]|uniref:Uncharacterized protein n=1 Tax=Myroides odoratus TaxID=256 RepID=A0A9Q6Z346_MYROD|nr:hypothetical protein [Myroides odoratus]EHQ41521.1 hypothetical protein Myrod_0685 [Myroides odoratus DSM 2801]EKB02686.1 hypothetical protein HMPREF9716_03715 [Myroides odoratus CIP 103059]QQT98943.1 hypothetical protein I6I88_12045 [Myroides odoratus]WQD58870.1 hypothetical protein U0010_06930 [Myroides odoratus]STZ28784.1 Uncharacterised protein [Myroides odoratus]